MTSGGYTSEATSILSILDSELTPQPVAESSAMGASHQRAPHPFPLLDNTTKISPTIPSAAPIRRDLGLIDLTVDADDEFENWTNTPSAVPAHCDLGFLDLTTDGDNDIIYISDN